MSGYGELEGISSQALMNSMFWGITYFIVLFAPMYVYLNNFFSKEEREKATSFHEVIGYALVLQVAALFIFLVLGVFLQNINIGNSSLKPEKAFLIFFGNGNELIDTRWEAYLTNVINDSQALTKFGDEAKGVAFLANRYIGIFYRFFILILFFALMFFVIVNFTRRFKDGEQNPNVFSRLYATFFTSVAFTLLVILHSLVANSLPTSFGIPSDSIATNFVPYFQKVISETFYQ